MNLAFLKDLELCRSLKSLRDIPAILLQHDNTLQTILSFEGKRPVPTNKSKGKNRFNKTRIKCLHRNRADNKSTQLTIKVHTLVCFLYYTIYLRLKTQVFINESQVFILGRSKDSGDGCGLQAEPSPTCPHHPL
ncbi:hypothetical protein ILYODFUR_037818 [Ilyodon furcidens]|uniref:Uncharacterized protein n=1 Tax=Ilyodon furcidens TaxID=33524 RepID=A0ABV0UC53_9TELE